MIRHIVLLTWADGTTADQHQTVIDQLSTMPGLIPEIKSYELTSDAGISTGNANLAVVAEFDDADGYQAYATNADHVEIIATHIKPILAGRSAIQYTT